MKIHRTNDLELRTCAGAWHHNVSVIVLIPFYTKDPSWDKWYHIFTYTFLSWINTHTSAGKERWTEMNNPCKEIAIVDRGWDVRVELYSRVVVSRRLRKQVGVTGRISFRQIVWAELVSCATMEWHLQLSHATLRRLPRYITLHLSPNGYPFATHDPSSPGCLVISMATP